MWLSIKGQAESGITHQVPLFGEQRVTHVNFDVVDIPVAALLTAETILFEDILHLEEGKNRKSF